jgi:hypothetical protein
MLNYSMVKYICILNSFEGSCYFMNIRLDKLLEMKKKSNGYWGDRITSQMLFLGKLLQYNEKDEFVSL